MRLISLATNRRVTIAMATVAVLLFGSVALSRLPVSLLPDLSYPTLTVRTELDGAAPAEVENLISKPTEEALGTVKNVRQMTSISRAGQSDVLLEFGWGTDMDEARLEVREKIDALALPLEADRPILLRFDPSLDPILRYGFAFSADDERADEPDALRTLRRYGDEEIKKTLESTDGVAAVKVSGGLEDEVHVELDQEKLARLGLTPDAVVTVLRRENVNLSGGRLEQGVQQYLVRTTGEVTDIAGFGDLIVAQGAEETGSRPVYLRDVARVSMGSKERDAVSRMGGVEAVEVAIYKEGDANTVRVAESVKARLGRLRADLPEGVELVEVYDQSTFIASAVDEVVNAALIGGLLAILVLYLFLRDFRTTAIISISIPVSIVATFNLMYGAELSLNIMSLGGLALGIGLLVDNSIVVLESIAKQREAGLSRVDAAVKGASEVGTAVIASTLTTVAVFFPLVFVEGIAGQLFKDQALTVTFALLASLLVALTLIPMLASLGGETEPLPDLEPVRDSKYRAVKGVRVARRAVVRTGPGYAAKAVGAAVRFVSRTLRLAMTPFVLAFQTGYTAIARVYDPALAWSLRNRALVLLAAFGLFAGTLLLVPRLGVELIPQLAQGEFEAKVKLAPGTPLERTDALLAQVQRKAEVVSGVRSTFAVAGTGNRMDANPEEGGEHSGSLLVRLESSDAEAPVMAALRDAAQTLPGATVEFARPTLFSFDTPVEIELSGFDLDALSLSARSLAQKLGEDDRFADVQTSVQAGYPEVRVLFDRERAAALGLPVYQVAERVVTALRGDIATRYAWNDRRIDVLVRVQEDDRDSIEELRRLIVNPESARPVPLEAVADIVVATGPGEIRRIGQQRVALVTANLRYGDLGAAQESIGAALSSVALPPGVLARLGGQQEEVDSSFRSLMLALALAVFLVYLVMASQFESFLHPFVIFFSIPLAAVGAIWALWLTGSPLSVVVFIGFILLAGIVVNNAIVLIDLVNQLRDSGTPLYDAVREAGASRLRPILMTTLTTTLGLLPLATGLGDGAEIRAPMAITVIGGLVVSTVLTLVVIPVMYVVLDFREARPVEASERSDAMHAA